MAGDWLKVECCTPEKPEVMSITALMGWDNPATTVGSLFLLWRWFDQHTENGNAHGVSAALLDRLIGAPGFCESVQKVGWLIVTSDGISLPSFEKHNGKTAKSRALTARRVAKHEAQTSINAKLTASKEKTNAETNAQLTLRALPREDTRIREDNTYIPPTPLQESADHSSNGIFFDDVFQEMDALNPFPDDDRIPENSPARLTLEEVQKSADDFLIRWNANGVLVKVETIEFFNDRLLWSAFQGWRRDAGRWGKFLQALEKIHSGKLTLGDHWRQMRRVVCDPEVVDKILAGSFERKKSLKETINPEVQKGLTTKKRGFRGAITPTEEKATNAP